MVFKNKLSKLDSLLGKPGKTVIAFSGGVDSSFLLYRANYISGDNIAALTVKTPYMSSRETEEAIEFARLHSIDHHIIEIPIPGKIKYNQADRCYYCKKTIFGNILEFAEANGYTNVFDGTNADDLLEARPGIRALKELHVTSPLAEAGMTKEDIRKHAGEANLLFWDKPAMSCLLTRIPHDTKVTSNMLRMIEKAETVLFDRGYPGSRVRMHGNIARIESAPNYLEKMISDPEREAIAKKIKEVGFTFVTLDMEGYRTGSMDIPTVETKETNNEQ